MKSDLYFKKFGQSGRKIVILHGLFGSHKNWAGVATRLSNDFQVYVLDQRNHGKSRHFPTHSLLDLVNDLADFLVDQNIKRPILLGHSMGGMCVMKYALDHPQNVSALIVVDIAPRKYKAHHHKEFEVLGMDVAGFQTRKEIDQAMKKIHGSAQVRQFLMMNLEKDETGYSWSLNSPVLERSRTVENAKFKGNFAGPTLFLRGQESPYISLDDYDQIRNHFPDATINSIQGAGHWLHHSHQEVFLDKTRNFLNRL